MKIDFATIIGLSIGITIVVLAIGNQSDFSIFINLPGLAIVAGGTFASTMIKFPISGVFISLPIGLKAAFSNDNIKETELVTLSVKLVKIARKLSLLALEKEKVPNVFFRKGMQLAADGKDEHYIRKVLTDQMLQEIRREEVGSNVFDAIGDSAPAFGMFGTLVGLIQMLSNMDDPNTIGPAMAVALLTTLYGVLISQLIAYPISQKLMSKLEKQKSQQELMIECIVGIQNLLNPQDLRDRLEPFLPRNKSIRDE